MIIFIWSYELFATKKACVDCCVDASGSGSRQTMQMLQNIFSQCLMAYIQVYDGEEIPDPLSGYKKHAGFLIIFASLCISYLLTHLIGYMFCKFVFLVLD